MTKKDSDRFVAFFSPKAVIHARQNDLANIQGKIRDAIWQYRSHVHSVADKVKALHIRQLKSMYIVGYIVKVGVMLPDLPELEHYSAFATTIAADVVELASPLISTIVMLIPGGEIIGMILPIFFEGILGIIDVTKLDDEIDVANSNLQKLNSAIASNDVVLAKVLANVAATNKDLDDFEHNVFQTLGVQSWDQVLNMDIVSVRFQRDIDGIGNIETEQQAQDLEKNLRDGNERISFQKVFESKRDLIAKLKAMDGVQIRSTRSRRSTLSARSILGAAPPEPAAVSTATKGQTSGYASYECLEGKHRMEILKLKSYALAHQVVVLLRRMINMVFASHRGSSLGRDSSDLNSLHKDVRDKVRGLVNEASRTFASIITSLDIFEPSQNWMSHSESSTTALTGGMTKSLGIIVPAMLHGVLPHGGDVPKKGHDFQAWVQWKEVELQEAKNYIVQTNETLDSLSSELLNSLTENCLTWAGIGRTSADAEAVVSELQKVDSFSSFTTLKGFICQSIGDLEVQEEVLEMMRMRMYLERALRHIEHTKSQ